MKYILSIITIILAIVAFSFLPSHTYAQTPEVLLEPQHGIPLVIVYVNETEDDIAAARVDDPAHEYGNMFEMNSSENHSVRAIGDVEIRVPAEYAGEYGTATVPAGRMALKYIRGRGNSTWEPDENPNDLHKNPYKIHFDKKQDFFGMGKAKDWALMANALDITLLRNRITMWMGNRVGLPYTPQMVPVDLVMVRVQKDENGEEHETGRTYMGSYCLSETVEIGTNRLAIDELQETDTDETIITGGYLLAVYNASQDENKVPEASHFVTGTSGMRITNDTPEFPDGELSGGQEAQRDYIRNYMNELDQLIMESDEITPEIHAQIGEKLDFKSLADYWWIQEFAFNTDAFETGSTYMYKARDGKLYFGPLWDFDLAWSMRMGWGEGYVTGFNNTELGWVDRLREKDVLFVELLKERWNADDGIRKALKTLTDPDSGIIKAYSDEIRSSREADISTWPDNYENWSDKTYDAILTMTRIWIDKRAAWIDDNLADLNRVHYTFTYLADADRDEVFKTITMRGGIELDKGPDGPDKEGYVFTGWQDKITGADHKNYRPAGDMTFIPCYKKESEAKAPTGIYLSHYEEWVPFSPGDDGKDLYMNDVPLILPEDADVGNIVWTSSDESILYFGESEYPVVLRTGDVDLTVSIRNGLSKTLHLHIYDPNQTEAVFPESIRIEPSSYTIRKGETIQVLPKFLPEGQPLERVYSIMEPDNEEIVAFNPVFENIITGLKPGTVTVQFTAEDVTGMKSVTTSFKVTVVDDPEPSKPVSIENAKVDLSKKAYTYNGKVHKPSIRKVGGRTLTAGKDYTLKWSKASPKKIGTYTVTVIGKGNYTGRTKAKFKINPRGTKILKLRKARKSVTVSWRRQAKKMPSARISGYQLQYAVNKKFTKNRKTLKIKGFKRNSRRVTGLKRKKTYYFRIRTFMKVRGTRYVSKWSKVRKVKTK